MTADPPRPVYLVSGDDPGIVSQALSALVESLRSRDAVGASSVEEFGDPAREEPLEVGEILNACRTAPFFSSLRIVVVRDLTALDARGIDGIVEYLGAPLETTVLVLASSGGRQPKRLLDAVRAHGEVIATTAGISSRDRSRWVTDHLRDHHLSFDGPASAMLADHLGEDLARLEGILGALDAAYGPGTRIGVDELVPFLGEAGGVAPWELSDAIDDGDLPRAITTLHRLLDGGARHPLQVFATLQRHVGAIASLDGIGAVSDAEAAAASGLSPFPAKKALNQARRLGHDKVVEMVRLAADADLDLRGQIGWPPELVLEVLVGRLARLSPKRAARRS
jgi:DNA polymerase III subunit delta